MGTGNPNKLLRKSSDPQIGRTALVMATRRKIEKRLNGLRIGEMQTKDITLKLSKIQWKNNARNKLDKTSTGKLRQVRPQTGPQWDQKGLHLQFTNDVQVLSVED